MFVLALQQGGSFGSGVYFVLRRQVECCLFLLQALAADGAVLLLLAGVVELLLL